jgi:hypothetical protein
MKTAFRRPSIAGLPIVFFIIVLLVVMLFLFHGGEDSPTTATASQSQQSVAGLKSGVSESGDWAVTWNPTTGYVRAYKPSDTPTAQGQVITINASPVSSVSVGDDAHVRIIFESGHIQIWSIYSGQLVWSTFLVP